MRVNMKVNMKALQRLLDEEFKGNQTLLAKSLGIDRSHVNKVFKNEGKGAGAVFCGAIMKYCDINNLDYQDYIFLD